MSVTYGGRVRRQIKAGHNIVGWVRQGAFQALLLHARAHSNAPIHVLGGACGAAPA